MKLKIKENKVLKPIMIGEHKEIVTPTESWTMYTVELDEPIMLMGHVRKIVNLPSDCFEVVNENAKI